MAMRPLLPVWRHSSQPRPAIHLGLAGKREAPPAFSIASALGGSETLQEGQGLRTNR